MQEPRTEFCGFRLTVNVTDPSTFLGHLQTTKRSAVRLELAVFCL